jgi:phosphoribosylaminoimidazole-succinocarboxamide synthase
MNDALLRQLPHTLKGTDFPSLGERYVGKVRDVYSSGDRLVLITTDRLSAFDHVLTTLPFKGDLLNELAHFWFQKTAHVAKNHVIDKPDPCVTVAKRADPYPIEFVVRAYLTGSLWRDYEKGGDPYAIELPPAMKKDQAFERAIITPSTKAPKGQHDEPISISEIVRRGTMTQKQWDEAAQVALGLFAEGQQQARARGLILVDTKYELGTVKGELHVIDEMHTPDSSRYWVADEYEQRFARGEAQKMLDKENLRQWLISERGFSGHGPLPEIPDEVRVGLTEKYIAAYEQITGRSFPLVVGDVRARLEKNLRAAKLLT